MKRDVPKSQRQRLEELRQALVVVTMKKWLASTQVVVGEQKISGERLLKMVANKLGGSHYDPTLPPELAAMAPFSLAGVPSFYLTLARLGEVVVHLGRMLLERSKANSGE